jgi:PIN domain nuclease of toxin-antitoxin system
VGRATRAPRGPWRLPGDSTAPCRSDHRRSRISSQSKDSYRPSEGSHERGRSAPRARSGARALTVLDAFALVAFLADEPAAHDVEAILRDRHDEPAIGAANVAEAIDVLVRIYHHPVDLVDERLGWLLVGPVTVLDVDEAVGRLAGRLRARHYDRRSRQVSLADCLCLATAMTAGQPIATADPALADIARAEGVAVTPLPDSAGRRP